MKPASIWDWIGPFALMAVFIAFLSVSSSSRPVLCGAEEDCFRSWVGALSGWAALVGALLTINVMREQLAEQRRQTDHIKGENPPEIFFERAVNEVSGAYFSEITVTVINRNRRPLALDVLLYSGLPAGVAIGIRKTSVGSDVKDLPLSDFLPMRQVGRTIPGKEDGFPAERCTVHCYVFDGADLAVLSHVHPERWRRVPVNIEVRGLLKDAEDVPIQLTTSGFVSLDAE